MMARRPSNSPRWDDLAHGTDTPEQHAERMRLADEANASLRDAIGRASHEHWWTDAPDDESAWYCPSCGITRAAWGDR